MNPLVRTSIHLSLLLLVAVVLVQAGCASRIWEAPMAVSPEEQMKSFPDPGDHVGFSLKVSEGLIKGLLDRENYRSVYPEVYTLGGINEIHGLVYDGETGDIILVGKHDPQRQPITLDDLSVALKSRLVHAEWPLVSVDPTKETSDTDMQSVRFEGGIENSQFGADLLDADYTRLKRIGLGLLPPGIDIESYWDLAKSRPYDDYKVGSRFWFFPILHSVVIREGVASVSGLKIGVFTETLSAEINGKGVEDLSTFREEAGEKFAIEVSENFNYLAKIHPSFSRLQGLLELTALASAMEEMEEKPDLSFWLKDHQTKPVHTPKALPALSREEGRYVASGGIRLMVIAMRLKSGDVKALREAVLMTRPLPGSLTWTFNVEEWAISKNNDMENIASLLSKALFHQEKGEHDQAIVLFSELLSSKHEFAEAYNGMGLSYASIDKFGMAISKYNKALWFKPECSEVYYYRGLAYGKKGNYSQEIRDLKRASWLNQNLITKVNPKLSDAFYKRGLDYKIKGLSNKAIRDFTKAIELNPGLVSAYVERSLGYKEKGLLDKSISDLRKAVKLKPELVNVYKEVLDLSRLRAPRLPTSSTSGFGKPIQIRFPKPIVPDNWDAPDFDRRKINPPNIHIPDFSPIR